MKEFYRTAKLLVSLAKHMSDIHEDYQGKEHITLRENLLKPYRHCTVV